MAKKQVNMIADEVNQDTSASVKNKVGTIKYFSTEKVVDTKEKSDSLCVDRNTTFGVESCAKNHIVSGYTSGHTDTILTTTEKVVAETGKSDSLCFNKTPLLV